MSKSAELGLRARNFARKFLNARVVKSDETESGYDCKTLRDIRVTVGINNPMTVFKKMKSELGDPVVKTKTSAIFRFKTKKGDLGTVKLSVTDRDYGRLILKTN